MPETRRLRFARRRGAAREAREPAVRATELLQRVRRAAQLLDRIEQAIERCSAYKPPGRAVRKVMVSEPSGS